MLSGDRDMTKCHIFLHDYNNDDKAITLPRVFSKHSQAKNKDFSLMGLKTLWEKEKMLVTSISPLFHYVFKRLLQESS